ncbi:MAG: hypothetical protein IKN72_12860 [Clostridia bacterium]|nr:hypothetical protein [Clostridia bacterium]MBR3554258.1 hypothetical protein [Clostridia bacterium]
MEAIKNFFDAIYQSILTIIGAAGYKNGKIGDVVKILRDMFAGGDAE